MTRTWWHIFLTVFVPPPKIFHLFLEVNGFVMLCLCREAAPFWLCTLTLGSAFSSQIILDRDSIGYCISTHFDTFRRISRFRSLSQSQILWALVLRGQQFRPHALYLRQDPPKLEGRNGHDAKFTKCNGSFAKLLGLSKQIPNYISFRYPQIGPRASFLYQGPWFSKSLGAHTW